MDPKDARWIASILKILKSLETELLAYRVVYEAVQGSGLFPDLAQSLEAARKNAQPEMDEKYDEATEKLLSLHDEQEILEVLRKLDPKAPIN